jgi:hypothetical protein
MAVSRFGRFPIQMNFAENRNAATSPKMAAQPVLVVGDPMRGRGLIKGKTKVETNVEADSLTGDPP